MRLIDVPCLHCGAKKGEMCTGRPAWSGFHSQRIISRMRLESEGKPNEEKVEMARAALVDTAAERRR